MSVSSTLADAITALLNDDANTYSITFTAKRLAAPLTFKELEDLNTTVVSVFTGTKKIERRGRKGSQAFQYTYKPVVAIQRKLDGGDEQSKLAHADQLDLLREEIESVLADADLAGLSFVSFDEEQDQELYSAEAMQTLNVFAASIIVEYTD